MALEELYWVHVEHFPMHRKGLPSSVLGELISVLSHASAGQQHYMLSPINSKTNFTCRPYDITIFDLSVLGAGV